MDMPMAGKMKCKKKLLKKKLTKYVEIGGKNKLNI